MAARVFAVSALCHCAFPRPHRGYLELSVSMSFPTQDSRGQNQPDTDLPSLSASQQALVIFPLSFFFFRVRACEHSHVCRHRCGRVCLTLMLATVLNCFKSFAHSKNSAGDSDQKQLFYETLLAKHNYHESKALILEV